MVSALILKDLICNRENPFADVFSPSRFSAEEIPHIVKDGKKAMQIDLMQKWSDPAFVLFPEEANLSVLIL